MVHAFGRGLPPPDDPSGALVRNVAALTSGVLLWTTCHFGTLAALPLFLHDQGWDAGAIGFPDHDLS